MCHSRFSLFDPFSHSAMQCQRLQENKDLSMCTEIKTQVNKKMMGQKDDKKPKSYICSIQEALNQEIHLSTTYAHSSVFLKTLESFPL